MCAWAVAFFLLAPGTGAAAGGDARLGVEVMGGAPANLGTSMTVRQDGFATLRFDATYHSDALKVPIYWAVRLTRETDDWAWSVELMHHKVFLARRPAEIQAFGISHGFNFVTAQYAWPVEHARLRVGLGAVIAHPESEVRGMKWREEGSLFGEGYYVAGPALTIAAERRFDVWRALGLVAELRASAAPVSLPIVDGDVRFTSIALHAMLGIAIFQ